MTRCVAYCRVSTNSKDQANSYEKQQGYFERVITENANYENCGIFADRGISGTKLMRPEFEKMLIDAGLDIKFVVNDDNDTRINMTKYTCIRSTSRKPKFDLILVKDASRFARNILVEDIIRELQLNNVFISFLDLGLSTEKESDREIIQNKFSGAEWESRARSNRVKFGIIEGVYAGRISANNRLYGYKYHIDENRLEIIDDEAYNIREIFRMYIEGKGLRRIVDSLTDSGIFPRNSTKPFSKSSIKRILTNEKYAGNNIRLKYDTGIVFAKYSYPKINPKEQQMDRGKTKKIPSIISDEVFDKCQELFKGKINYINQVGIYKGNSDFAGKIICVKCGKSYNCNTDNGNKFYNCSTKKREGIKVCDNQNISKKLLDDVICSDSYVGEIFTKKVTFLRDLKRVVDCLKNRLDKNDTLRVEELQSELNSLDEKKNRYIELYVEGQIKKENFDLIIKPLNTDIVKIEKFIQEYSKSNDDILNDITNVENALEEMRRKEVNLEYSRQEILSDVEKIIVHENKQIEVVYKSQMIFRDMKEKYNLADLLKA